MGWGRVALFYVAAGELCSTWAPHGPRLSGTVSDITYRLGLMVPYDTRGPELNPACNPGPHTRTQDPTLTHVLKSEYTMELCIPGGIRSLVRFRCLRQVW